LKEYPSFKRKFRPYQANYHQATPQRELVQMFRENCMPDKIAVRVKKAEDMPTAWRIMDAVYDNSLAFIKDLMQEIRAVPGFKEEECEKMMEYYILLQSHIAEADKADVGAMLLILANIADMTRTQREGASLRDGRQDGLQRLPRGRTEWPGKLRGWRVRGQWRNADKPSGAGIVRGGHQAGVGPSQ
jgi:hypothetical protein